MTRYYIKLGSEVPFGTSEHRISYDPTDLSSASALWSALPPDLRLALAKTAPKVAGKWVESPFPMRDAADCVTLVFERRGAAAVMNTEAHVFEAYVGMTRLATFTTLASAQAACDAALLAQGYVLDGDTP